MLPLSTKAHQLSSDTATSSEGYFVLQWALDASDEEAPFVLEQADEATFEHAIHHEISREGQLTVTGLPDGHYYFRVGGQAQTSDWSDVVEVRVLHPSMGRALAFFSLGLALFALLTAIIIRGNRRHNLDHPESQND